MQIIKQYRNDEALRRSFNALAEKTFGLNFEHWYQLGYWGDAYEPYSVLEEGKIVANVSLNRTDLWMDGQRKRIYQLGTVMTDPAYRNRGCIRALMAQIEQDTADADGVYLFANDSVLEFYPRFGFEKNREFVYEKTVDPVGPRTMVPVSMDCRENRDRLQRAMEASTFPTGCTMVDNPGLIFFYAAQFLKECVYYSEPLDAWAIGEEEDGALTLHAVFAPGDVSLDAVLAAFGAKQVILGFTPANPEGWTCRELKEEDCTFFTKGDCFRDFAQKKLRIPTLSHA